MAGFIEPDRELETAEDPAAKLGVPIFSGYKALADSAEFADQNRIYDRILARQLRLDLKYEDQCSAQYYFDLVRTLRDFNGQFDRVVEVGVYLGGASSVLAGCIQPFDFDLDMVDIGANYLRFAYERVRRLFPEAAGRIRLFHGDLPSYVRQVMLKEPHHACVVHHDGAHDFNQVVKDMASLYYARESLFAVIAQDTHLRGKVKSMNFVDLALMAVFGQDLKCATIGASYEERDSRTAPNQYQGNYFMPNMPEGLVLPMAANRFHYPHPDLPIDDFLPAEP
jgi:hypothetical protein